VVSSDLSYPEDAGAFVKLLGEVKRVLDTDLRLPKWPFTAPVGHADICQFDWVVAGDFGAVLDALVVTYGDEAISFVVLEPTPKYYQKNYGSYPTFVTAGATIADRYWELLSYEPGGDPAGAAINTANVVAIVGSSGAWAVWAERSWGLAIVLSQHVNGPWTSRGVNFVPVEEALANFTEPDFKVRLARRVRSRFLQNVRDRGEIR
jgi:hypothetical protein